MSKDRELLQRVGNEIDVGPRHLWRRLQKIRPQIDAARRAEPQGDAARLAKDMLEFLDDAAYAREDIDLDAVRALAEAALRAEGTPDALTAGDVVCVPRELSREQYTLMANECGYVGGSYTYFASKVWPLLLAASQRKEGT